MSHEVLDIIGPLFTSPWIYLIVFVLAAVDAFLPLVPSETVVITAGVFAASGEPALGALLGSVAFGAFVGDTISYLIGRRAGRRLEARLLRSQVPERHERHGRHGRFGRCGRQGWAGRRLRAYAWARRALQARGGLLIVAARFVPGGRTATTLTAGAVGYDQRRFQAFAGLAAALWAAYSVFLGYFGGVTADGNPLKGMLFGLGAGAVLTVVIESVRRVVAVRRRRRRPLGPSPPEPVLTSPRTG